MSKWSDIAEDVRGGMRRAVGLVVLLTLAGLLPDTLGARLEARTLSVTDARSGRPFDAVSLMRIPDLKQMEERGDTADLAPQAYLPHGGAKPTGPSMLGSIADRGKTRVKHGTIRLARMLEFRPPRRAAPPPRPPRLRASRRPPPGLRSASPPRRPPRPPSGTSPRIAPSTALQAALQLMPGSLGLGVELLPGPKPVYSVKLKTGNRIHRVLVDALNGHVIGR